MPVTEEPAAQKETRIMAIKRRLRTLRERITEEEGLEHQVVDLAGGYGDILTETLGKNLDGGAKNEPSPGPEGVPHQGGALGEIEGALTRLEQKVVELEELAGGGLELQKEVHEELVPGL